MKTNLTIVSAVAALALVGLTTSALAESNETQAQLQAQAKITQADAQKTALAKVPNGRIKSSELENEGGKLVWSFDIVKPGTKDIAEVLVDAKTGAIVKMENETPKQQANEAAADKAAKK
ncbi:MAG: PepSY domain-containing protein [Verrucomicrobiota bacterium]|nr:PepSY domain-containing protein [Verrucomicrobiota bacterium]